MGVRPIKTTIRQLNQVHVTMLEKPADPLGPCAFTRFSSRTTPSADPTRLSFGSLCRILESYDRSAAGSPAGAVIAHHRVDAVEPCEPEKSIYQNGHYNNHNALKQCETYNVIRASIRYKTSALLRITDASSHYLYYRVYQKMMFYFVVKFNCNFLRTPLCVGV